MKIGNNADVNTISDNLLERIQQAHHDAKTEAVEKIGASTSHHGEQIRKADALQAAENTEETIDHSKLQSRLLWVAESVLEDKFATPQQARCEVVEAIVDEKFGEGLEDDERARVTSVLQNALIDDPEFVKEVDNMLIAAAQLLGQGADPTAK